MKLGLLATLAFATLAAGSPGNAAESASLPGYVPVTSHYTDESNSRSGMTENGSGFVFGGGPNGHCYVLTASHVAQGSLKSLTIAGKSAKVVGHKADVCSDSEVIELDGCPVQPIGVYRNGFKIGAKTLQAWRDQKQVLDAGYSSGSDTKDSSLSLLIPAGVSKSSVASYSFQNNADNSPRVFSRYGAGSYTYYNRGIPKPVAGGRSFESPIVTTPGVSGSIMVQADEEDPHSYAVYGLETGGNRYFIGSYFASQKSVNDLMESYLHKKSLACDTQAKWHYRDGQLFREINGNYETNLEHVPTGNSVIDDHGNAVIDDHGNAVVDDHGNAVIDDHGKGSSVASSASLGAGIAYRLPDGKRIPVIGFETKNAAYYADIGSDAFLRSNGLHAKPIRSNADLLDVFVQHAAVYGRRGTLADKKFDSRKDRIDLVAHANEFTENSLSVRPQGMHLELQTTEGDTLVLDLDRQGRMAGAKGFMPIVSETGSKTGASYTIDLRGLFFRDADTKSQHAPSVTYRLASGGSERRVEFDTDAGWFKADPQILPATCDTPASSPNSKIESLSKSALDAASRL